MGVLLLYICFKYLLFEVTFLFLHLLVLWVKHREFLTGSYMRT